MFTKFFNKLGTKEMLTLQDLENHLTDKFIVTTTMRKNTKILIIDDKGFDEDPLKSVGFLDITKIYDHSNIDEYVCYDIILCDVNGVAVKLDTTYQGAALAREIKNKYPDKMVVIYSAFPQKITLSEYAKCVDDIIDKDLSPSMIANKLDGYIKSLKDPISFWKKAKKELMSIEISTKNVSLLEHYYVKSILKNKKYTKNIIDLGSYLLPADRVKVILDSVVLLVGML
jgi:hypothetical protein